MCTLSYKTRFRILNQDELKIQTCVSQNTLFIKSGHMFTFLFFVVSSLYGYHTSKGTNTHTKKMKRAEHKAFSAIFSTTFIYT
jgi:hypothetical protein